MRSVIALMLLTVALIAARELPAAQAADGTSRWTWRPLPMDPEWAGASAWSIDESDQTIIGSAYYKDWTQVGVVWRGSGFSLLLPPSGSGDLSASPSAVNSMGIVVGLTYGASYVRHATVWDLRKDTARSVHPGDVVLDGVLYNGSLMLQVNDKGDAIGYLTSADWRMLRAYIWSRDGKMDGSPPLLAGTVQSLGEDIHEQGFAVGICRDATGQDFACLWPRDGGVVDLHAPLVAAFPDLDIRGSGAFRVDRDGSILGFADVYDPTLRPHVVEWRPDGEIVMFERGPGNSALAYGLSGRRACGSLDGVWWRPDEPALAAIWEDGLLRHVGNPSGYPWAELFGINRHGTAVGYAFAEDNFWELTLPVPFVLERTEGKGKDG